MIPKGDRWLGGGESAAHQRSPGLQRALRATSAAQTHQLVSLKLFVLANHPSLHLTELVPLIKAFSKLPKEQETTHLERQQEVCVCLSLEKS